MLHSKKIEAILQWFNALTTKRDVKSLEQFSDGSHFYEIVTSLQLPFSKKSKDDNLAVGSETYNECTKEEEAVEEKTGTSVSESMDDDPYVFKESDSDHSNIQKKYDAIRKFIDDSYHINSSSIINYEECQNSKDLELAKVAIFLFSAMVQNLLSTNSEALNTTTLLEPEIQENIRECLSLVLVERDLKENPLNKLDLHRILGQPASFNGTPVRKQPSRNVADPFEFSEGIKNVPKKRKERTCVSENILDSPLRNLLDSPKVQYKAAIFRMEKEMANLRSALYNEENKAMDLTQEKIILNEELEKTKKELEYYKKELQSMRQELCDKEQQEKMKGEALKDIKIENERVKKFFEPLEEEIKQLKENNEALQEKLDSIEKKKQEVTALSKENSALLEKIQILELDNGKKKETIKTLNEKVTELEKNLKTCKEIQQELVESINIKERNSRQSTSTIIYADEKEEEKRIRNLESNNSETVKQLKNKKHGPDEKTAKDSNSLKNQKALGSTYDGVSKINNSFMKDLECHKDGASDSGTNDFSTGKFFYEKTTLASMIKVLEKNNLIYAPFAKTLTDSCIKITVPHEFSACLRDLLEMLGKNLEICNANLMKETENLKQQLNISQENYLQMEKLLKKKKNDVRRAFIMYQKLAEIGKKSSDKKGCSEECERLRKSEKQLKNECNDYGKQIDEYQQTIKFLQGELTRLEQDADKLQKEKEDLQKKLWFETKALSKNTAERDAVVFHYLSESKHEPSKKFENIEFKKRELKNSSWSMLNFSRNADDERCASNSMLASRSIRNSFFQTADEDDFLNESSLAEIHNGGTQLDASGEKRLQELQRRNTLCLPHLQSSYPLEIQNMTPSEKKYYDLEESSFNIRTSSLYQRKESFRKPKSKNVEWENSNDHHSFITKKRKVVDTNIFAPPSKKHCQASSAVAKAKPATPLKRVAALVRLQSFKTPIQKLCHRGKKAD